MFRANRDTSVLTGIVLLKGRKEILRRSGLLEALAARCGQDATMSWLSHFIGTNGWNQKTPVLVLLLHSPTTLAAMQLDDVHAAVLLFEHRLMGISTRTFATDNDFGYRTVVAPPGERRLAATTAVKALLEHRAQVVLVSGEDQPEENDSMASLLQDAGTVWTRQEREVRHTLHLEETYEATLAKLGKATRFNLRYYRRRLASRMDCEVVPDARGLLSADDLVSLNEGSHYPITPAELHQRYAAVCNLPGGYLFGLRAPDGQWLSLIGGWRQGTTTVLSWQLNSRGFDKDSLTTVIRSYFIEHEVKAGVRKLTVYGGTTHTINHSFESYHGFDLVVRRNSLYGKLICLLARVRVSLFGYPPGNGLTKLLCNPMLKWSSFPAKPSDSGILTALDLFSRKYL